VGHPAGQNGLERAVTATMRAVFPHVARDPIRETTTSLVASENPLSTNALRSNAEHLPAGLSRAVRNAAYRLSAPLAGGPVYTDDKAPVEWLIDKSIIDYAAGEH
jgi:hypothetical protein